MLFREQLPGALAISQPAHAWISGQLLRAWDERFGEPLLIAAEQHDIGWIDWEITPTFDPQTGRPHLFRAVSASLHAPMWARGVERALAAWGTHVALLVSRHGGLIYRRYFDPNRLSEADAAAVRGYLDTQGPIETCWIRHLRIEHEVLEKESALIAVVDALSLAICGDLKTPLELSAPKRNGEMETLRLTARPDQPFDFFLSPWPFRTDTLAVEAEALSLPQGGRLCDESHMRTWLASPERTTFRAGLAPL
jgi:hypothetical protein